ncbi:MAG: hypothetical protein ACLVHE_03745 [Dialister invisus]
MRKRSKLMREKADFLISYYEKEGKAYDPDDQFSFLGLGIAAVLPCSAPSV